jgi:hypothetical protein
MPIPTNSIKHKGLSARANNYIFPPRAQDAIPLSEAAIFANLGWIAQFKYNDSRCLIKYQPGQTPELWNRHAEQFRTYQAPDRLTQQLEEVHTRLGLSKTAWSLIDGGLFNDKHAAIKNTIVIWDILVMDGIHLLGSTYLDRYNFLKGNLDTGASWMFGQYDFGIKISDDILMPRNYGGGTTTNDGNPPGNTWKILWDEVITRVNEPYTTGKPGDWNYDCKPVLEGLVFKNGEGKLTRGMKEKNNSEWMVKSRVQTGRHLF